jgi:alcohol dehydrogenase (NADP+)
MQTLRFANNDEMPILGLGTWKAKPGEVGKAVRDAIKAGYRHIDCAAIYGNEAEIGGALEAAMQAGEVKREDLWITSKLWNNAHAQDQVPLALQQSLHDLRLDYLDLYLIHWPVAFRPEVLFPMNGEAFLTLDEMPLFATWTGMETCVQKRLTRHIGVSNFSLKHLDEIRHYADIQPEMNQIELHPFLQQNAMLAYCQQHNIKLTAYSPLGSGDRPEMLKGPNERSLLENGTVAEIAEGHACSSAQVLLSWAMARGTAVIPKSVNPARLVENFESTNIILDMPEREKLAILETGARYVHGEFWTIEGSPYTIEELWGE